MYGRSGEPVEAQGAAFEAEQGHPFWRAKSIISCSRGPPAPLATRIRSSGLPARNASATG